MQGGKASSARRAAAYECTIIGGGPRTIIGGGPLLSAMSDTMGAGIVFRDPAFQDIPDEIASADLLLQPAMGKITHSPAILEAYAATVPIVHFPVGGTLDYVSSATSVLLEEVSVEHITAKVEILLGDRRKHYLQMILRARKPILKSMRR